MITELIYNANLQYIDGLGELCHNDFKESILKRDVIDDYLNMINERDISAPNQDDPNDLLEKIMSAYFQIILEGSIEPESPENKINFELISFKTDGVNKINEQ